MQDFEKNKVLERVNRENFDRSEGIKDKNGRMLDNDKVVNENWAKFYEKLWNVDDDDRDAVIDGVGNDRRMPMCERCVMMKPGTIVFVKLLRIQEMIRHLVLMKLLLII